MNIKLENRFILVTKLSGTDSSLNNSACERVDVLGELHTVPAHGGQVGSGWPLQPPGHGQMGGVYYFCVCVCSCPAGS